MVSWGVPYDQLTEEEKTRAWFTDGSALYAGITRKWTAAILQSLSRTPLKGSGKRKFFQWAELQTAFGFALCLEGEMARCVIMY